MSNQVETMLTECISYVRGKTDFRPEAALVLGSGLGTFADRIAIAETVDYSEIHGFPVSTVAGHKGRFVFGYVDNVPVVIMQGRVHYYEGYSMKDVVLPIRLMHALGANTLILTNAAGGISDKLACGDLMLITDHISCFVENPLIGPNLASLGDRFPDMSEVYDKTLRQCAHACADRLDIPLKEGVYLQLTGPSYETPAEIRMCKALGADAVGMSTAVEAIAANHMGMHICGISLISNLAAGISREPLAHADVKRTADEAAEKFEALLCAVIKEIPR